MKHSGEERVISAVLDMRKQGLGLRQIASFLSKIGVPTKRRGKTWHPEMVKRILLRGSVGKDNYQTLKEKQSLADENDREDSS